MKCTGSVTSCWLFKIPPRLHLLFFSHCLKRKKKKSFGLCLCIAQVLIMYGLHLASGSMLQTCFYDREDGLFLLWYLFFSCLEFFDIFSTISVAFFGLLSAWKSWIKGPTKYVQNNSVSQERSFVRIF